MRAKEFGTNPKRPARPGSRPERGHKVEPRYKKKHSDSEEWYDRHGNLDPNGAFDAGGHYHLERDMDEGLKDPKDNPCWKGYHPVGTKKKGGRTVPNCVPNESISEDWNKVNKKDKTDGLSQKAVNAYRRENPGSKLQTAVTTKPSKLKAGSKDAKRRKSFCARMSGNKGPMKDEKGRPTPKAKALRRWNCEEGMQSIEDWLLQERGKASRRLCQSGIPDEDLGASQLASCKSQGLRARDGEKSHLIGHGGSKVRVTVGGKKIKGQKYGGPLPDYGTRKGQK